MILKLATIETYDKDFEEWETHRNVTTIIEQNDMIILLHADGKWQMLNKLRYDINQPVWKTYKVVMEETKNVAFEQ